MTLRLTSLLLTYRVIFTVSSVQEGTHREVKTTTHPLNTRYPPLPVSCLICSSQTLRRHRLSDRRQFTTTWTRPSIEPEHPMRHMQVPTRRFLILVKRQPFMQEWRLSRAFLRFNKSSLCSVV